MNPIIATERLLLREFTLKDASFILALVNSRGWLENIGDRNIKTQEQAIAYLQNGPIKSYKEHGFGLYAVTLKKEITPIGMCGLVRRAGLDHPDIGFAFLPEFTGNGFAYEAAHATMAFGREILRLASILAITIPSNKQSVKLLEKIGLTFIRTFSFPGDQQELMLFSTVPERQ